MQHPKISIITINYRQSETTNDLLRSFDKVDWPNFELIIVDNSLNDDYKNLETNRRYVRLIVSNKNKGFAGGNNLGIEHATGDFILLLNNDTVVAPDFLNHMVDTFKKYPDAGAVSPKIKYYDKPSLIQYAGFTKMSRLTLRMNAVGHKKEDDGTYDTEHATNYAHGCAMMVSREVLNSVGLMPEEYFLYYEEHDWSTMIKRAGYKIYYQPASVVLHKESVSTQKNSPLKTYFINRNRILFMKRNFGRVQQMITALYILTVSVPKQIFSFLITNRSEHLEAYLDALAWNINHKTKAKWNF